MTNIEPKKHEHLSKQEKYQTMISYWQGISDPSVDWIANTSNAAALLKELFNWWWVGFYRVEQNELILGPFQGPTACTKIPYGKGVCGKSWEIKATIVVSNVHDFEGHIACSSASNSEIVVPIWKNNVIWGVLDVDSEHFDYFDDIDQKYLEILCQYISELLQA